MRDLSTLELGKISGGKIQWENITPKNVAKFAGGNIAWGALAWAFDSLTSGRVDYSGMVEQNGSNYTMMGS